MPSLRQCRVSSFAHYLLCAWHHPKGGHGSKDGNASVARGLRMEQLSAGWLATTPSAWEDGRLRPIL
ncbi:unnamed protein product [Rangifer tarandus platyrhynchus]|uniref:Uncharacterized protein n=1 Tax=Rangifer tarandus platyrhynchus TaxID=3082113 RepID=A0AC59Y3Y9_RANTA